MKLLRAQDGIALVTSLMLTLISLTIVMALLYMITQGTQASGQFKRYKSALDAVYGGSEIIVKDIFPFVLKNYSSSTLKTDLENPDPQIGFGSVSMTISNAQASCLQSKLTHNTADWPSGCSNSPFASKDPDFSIKLQSTSGSPYVVYSKIVDTSVGNSNMGGLQLEGAGVAETQSILTPQHFPYVYRLEIQGQRETNASARANIEVLYAY